MRCCLRLAGALHGLARGAKDSKKSVGTRHSRSAAPFWRTAFPPVRTKQKLPEKTLILPGSMHHKSAIQGINSGLGMVNVDLLHISNFAQTGNLGIHAVKAASGLELAQPGICVIASHIVVGMISGYDH